MFFCGQWGPASGNQEREYVWLPAQSGNSIRLSRDTFWSTPEQCYEEKV